MATPRDKSLENNKGELEELREKERKAMKIAKEQFNGLKSPTQVLVCASPLHTLVTPGSGTRGWSIYNCCKAFNDDEHTGSRFVATAR